MSPTNKDRDDIRLLSIGTTTSRYSLPASSGTNFGLVNWAFNSRLWSAIIAAQQQIVTYMSGYLLHDRYVRVDALQSEEQKLDLALDVATPNAQRIIGELASRAIAENSDGLDRFLSHDAPDAVFFHGPNAR